MVKPAKTVFKKRKPLAENEKAVASAMQSTLPQVARGSLIRKGVRDTTDTGYYNAAERADEIAKLAGFEEGMRTEEAFTCYLWARVSTGQARGNSTVTHLRSALAFREKCEGFHPWPDEEHIREMVRCHNYAGKRAHAGEACTMRGALTAELLKSVQQVAEDKIAVAVTVQYHACLRPHEVLSLAVDCLSPGYIRIDSNKRFRRTNAQKQGPTQRKPVSATAAAVVKVAIQAAQAAGKKGGARIFDMTLDQYRKGFAAAIKKSGIAMDGLVFVPHSARHGRVADWQAGNAPVVGLTEEQLAMAGMSRTVSVRYGRSNAERQQIAAGADEPDDSESSEDEAPEGGEESEGDDDGAEVEV
jgi:hypothetical protein